MKTEIKMEKKKAGFSTNGVKAKKPEGLQAKVYHDEDADLKWLQKKRVVVVGYGSQGHGQALNLRDSGIDVRIAVRKGGRDRQAWGAAALVFALTLTLAGGYYWRNVRTFGKPFVVANDAGPTQRFFQVPGYRNLSFFTRFGAALFCPPDDAVFRGAYPNGKGQCEQEAIDKVGAMVGNADDACNQKQVDACASDLSHMSCDDLNTFILKSDATKLPGNCNGC